MTIGITINMICAFLIGFALMEAFRRYKKRTTARYFLVSYRQDDGIRGCCAIRSLDGVFRLPEVVNTIKALREPQSPTTIEGVFELTKQEYQESK